MNTNEMKRKILFPINGFGREFDGKLLLALLAQERGFHPFIGAKSALHRKLRELSPALYIAKSAHGSSVDFFARMRRLGNQIALLDEESLVRQSDEIYMMKHRKDALKDVALLLTWGQDDLRLWQSSGLLYQASAAAVGNPRVDMLRPATRSYHGAEVSSIVDRFGNYVLINTNFPRVNHAVTLGENVTSADKTEHAARAWRKFLDYKRCVFERFKDIIPELARYVYPRNLVVRPHPSELQEPWLDVSKGHENVHVIREGGIVPWLIGARALIHNGCTSAIEYALLDKLPLSYRLEELEPYEDSLPNHLSVSCHTKDALLRELGRSLARPEATLPEKQRQILNDNIEMSADRLCGEAVLDAVQNTVPAPRNVCTRYAIVDFNGIWDAILAPIRGFRKSMRSDRGRRRADALNKFPNLGTDYIDARIKRFQDCLGRFHGMRSRQVARRLFELVE